MSRRSSRAGSFGGPNQKSSNAWARGGVMADLSSAAIVERVLAQEAYLFRVRQVVAPKEASAHGSTVPCRSVRPNRQSEHLHSMRSTGRQREHPRAKADRQQYA